MKKICDFRSDTVTKPTEVMRAAMAKAEVGDDVYGEDPSVIKLEEMAAKMLDKEAGLFVTSGTMGNLLAVLAVCGRGDEVIMGRMGHTFLHEAGGVSALGGVVINTIPNQADGSLALEDIRNAMRDSEDIHEPISKMLIVENTQNFCGGKPLSASYMNESGALAKELGLHFHVDGARIFNAAVALSLPASALTESADSLTFCLSKGLCAPVGSVLVGSTEFIKKARRLRKMLGGGMRQAGILAAAGVVSLESMIDRLAEDHRRAKLLADGLAEIPGIQLTKDSPNTNMVFLKLEPLFGMNNAQFIGVLKEKGVLLNEATGGEIRLVTHHDIDDEAIEICLRTISSLR
ncbi:MAG: low-specificity L-threonine aldolase [Anaerolineaceae bacterium]|nr:low-specificity L-threonine aldolase [Anaerolineaceae bacterium]